MHLVFHGTSDARSMVSGYKFTLTEHYREDMNASYLLTDIEHIAHTTGYGSRRGTAEEHYSNSFRCIPASVPFRPLRVTPRPTVMGPNRRWSWAPRARRSTRINTAGLRCSFSGTGRERRMRTVPAGFVCRSSWAGKNWGAMFFPRIGQEVIVDFLEGDPDQPADYRASVQRGTDAPGSLPTNMNVSGFRSHSTKGGGQDDRMRWPLTTRRVPKSFTCTPRRI